MTRGQFLAGSQELSPGSAFVLEPRAGRVIGVTASVAGIDGKLPPATEFHEGGPIAFVLNLGSNSFDIVDQGDNVIHSLAGGDAATVLSFDNTTANGDWDVVEDPILS